MGEARKLLFRQRPSPGLRRHRTAPATLSSQAPKIRPSRYRRFIPLCWDSPRGAPRSGTDPVCVQTFSVVAWWERETYRRRFLLPKWESLSRFASMDDKSGFASQLSKGQHLFHTTWSHWGHYGHLTEHLTQIRHTPCRKPKKVGPTVDLGQLLCLTPRNHAYNRVSSHILFLARITLVNPGGAFYPRLFYGLLEIRVSHRRIRKD
jgi:hypothetical protein